MGVYNPLYTQHLMDKHGVSWFKFDETSGNAIDSKGTAVGTVTGATRITGWNGQGSALSFDGIDDNVSFSVNPLASLGAMSLRFKIKATSTATFRYLLATINSYSTQVGIGVSIVANTGQLEYGYSDGTGIKFLTRTNKSIADNQWHDVLIIWDGKIGTGNVKIYVDNMSAPDVISNSTGENNKAHSFTLILGRLSGVASGWFMGDLDELEIYNEVIEPIPNKLLLSSQKNDVLTYTDNMMKYGVSKFGFDEFSGNVIDAKGTAIGTVTGATRVTGWDGVGNALSFDGNDYVSLNSKVIPVGKKSIRFKIKSSSNSHGIIFSTSGWNSQYRSGLSALKRDTGVISFLFNNGTTTIYTIDSTSKVNDGQWHDVLFTWDGTINEASIKVYIDDMVTPDVTKKPSALEVYSNLTDNLTLGMVSSTPNTTYYYLVGEIDNLEIYNDVINPLSYKKFIKLPSQSEKNFINHGMSQSDLSSVDMSSDFTEKHYIQDVSTVLGTGKVFEHVLDVNKVLKKITIK